MTERTQRCETCFYWEADIFDEASGVGDCHRYAPRPAMEHTVPRRGEDLDAMYALWPVTGCMNFCGEWASK